MPALQNRIHDPPGDFDFIAPGEERGIPIQGIGEQPLISVGQGIVPEIGAVMKLHIHRARLLRRAWHLCLEPEMDPLIRLDTSRVEAGCEIVTFL